MPVITLEGSQRSHIYIEEGLLTQGAALALQGRKAEKVCIVTDSNVAPLYLDQVEQSYAAQGVEVCRHIIPAGEEHKQLSTVSSIYQTLCTHSFTRSDLLVALGGGVVGDITGFAAATFLRGIPVVQMPTTLLSQVDSSVGGKCGVDLPQGKNLVGAFYQPSVVLIDPQVLSSLPQSTFADGMAEVIKYGCILDPQVLTMAREMKGREAKEIITRCVELKAQVVEQDEKDTGLRMILNFGHTLGHAIEKLGNFTAYTHGQGVAMGMMGALQMGKALGITPEGCQETLEPLLAQYHLPTQLPYGPEELFSALQEDKKRSGSTLRFLLLTQMGSATPHPIPLEELHALMTRALTK